MDLALEFGMPYEQLASQMTEREFRQWGEYRARRLLPMRRLEMHLAQICRWIAMTSGRVSNATIQDFLIEVAPADEVARGEVVDEANARDFFRFNPRPQKHKADR